MVNMSKGMIASYLTPYALTPGYKKVFIAFDGTMPTLEEINALYGADNELNLSDLVDFGQTKGALRGHFLYGADFVAEMLNPAMYRWLASERSEDMTIASLGAVTWFIFAIVDDTVNNLDSAGLVYDAMVGTVSEVGEDGDVYIPGAIIGGNQNYLVNDIELSYGN